MKIITGKTGKAHVASEDTRALYASLIGSGDYVLNINNKFEYELIDSNTIRIKSGDLLCQGTHGRVPNGTYDELEIASGASGYKRIDLIVASYRMVGGIESMELNVVQGIPALDNPTVPTVRTGNIINGDEAYDMVLYEININGINVDSVVQKFTVLETELADIGQVGAIYSQSDIAITCPTDTTVYGASIDLDPGVYVITVAVATKDDTYDATSRQLSLHAKNEEPMICFMGDTYRSYARMSHILVTYEKQTVQTGFYQSSVATITGTTDIRAVRIK